MNLQKVMRLCGPGHTVFLENDVYANTKITTVTSVQSNGTKVTTLVTATKIAKATAGSITRHFGDQQKIYATFPGRGELIYDPSHVDLFRTGMVPRAD